MKSTIAIMALLLASPAWAEEQRFDTKTGIATSGPCAAEKHNWHLLTKSQVGTVSLIKGLTEEECRTAQEKLWPHCPVNAVCATGSGGIEIAECFE